MHRHRHIRRKLLYKSKKLTIENIKAVERVLNTTNKEELINTLKVYSSKVYKKDYILLVLARCCSVRNDRDFKQRCFNIVSNICSTPTLLFLFIEFYQAVNKALYNSKGWNKNVKKFVSDWYHNRPADKLLYQVLKYQNRNGWCHKDILRLAHIVPKEKKYNYIYQFLTKGTVNENMDTHSKTLIDAVKNGETISNIGDMIDHITNLNLSREMIHTKWLSSKEIWQALLLNMPAIALLRNLNKMSL